MKTLISALVAVSFCTASFAQALSGRGTPLDHLAGRWVMKGTIAGEQVTHDLNAEWVLGGHYLYFHERARERDEQGDPAYEARVYFGWDEAGEQLVCLWLDVTGGGGLAPGGFGYGKPQGNRIPFVWGEGANSGIHNTFSYRPDSDSWSWEIDNIRDGQASQFARVVLTRNGAASPASDTLSEAREQILLAIARLSDATAPGGGGADVYAEVLAEDFSRWTLNREGAQGRAALIEGIRQWLEEGWRVADRSSRMIDTTVVGHRAFTHRVVTESYVDPDGALSAPSTFALEETWQKTGEQWQLQRVTVYPVAD